MRALLCAAALATAMAASTYDREIQAWRLDREAKLKADSGWLTVAGLFWLHEGENPAGSDPSSVIKLPRGPGRLGIFELHNGAVSFHPGAGVDLKAAAALKPDSAGDPDLVQTGDLTMFVIHRGNRYGIRLKDKQSEFRRKFTGLTWYPVRAEYRVAAKWVAYPQPKMMAVPNILGETERQPSPGYAVFSLRGHEYKLYPVLEDKQLFFIFRDQTSGNGTYPSGRFLYAGLPPNGEVILDFNKAYNPPCAFTPYATCPLPPPENRLPTHIEAGELNFGDHSRKRSSS